MPTSHDRSATKAWPIHLTRIYHTRSLAGVNVHHIRESRRAEITTGTRLSPGKGGALIANLTAHINPEGWILSLNGAAPRTWGRHASASPLRRLIGSIRGAGRCVI
jgi:hypothetical protein